MMREYDLAVVGGGVAGLTAGMFGGRYGLKTILLERMMIGGQILNVERIENYPGFPQGISGADLAMTLQQQAIDNGCIVEMATVDRLLRDNPYLILETTEGSIRARVVIIAAGSTLRRLGVAGETEHEGRGVSYCATCDGPLFTGQVVGVVGGGDSAADEALTLTQYASKIILFHRRDQLSAQRILRDRVLGSPKIEVRWNTEVTEVLGNDEGNLRGVRVRNTKTGQSSEVGLAGLFIYTGLEPNTAFFQGVVDLDNAGHVITDVCMQTTVPGVYAAGDIRQRFPGQLINCVSDGATAAINAAQWIAKH